MEAPIPQMPTNPRIYLDHAATTPVIQQAREAMAEGLERWANPSSPHHEGRAARAALEDARRRIAAALNWAGEVILTSGATESINIGLNGLCAQHLTAGENTVEHSDEAARDGDQNKIHAPFSPYIFGW